MEKPGMAEMFALEAMAHRSPDGYWAFAFKHGGFDYYPDTGEVRSKKTGEVIIKGRDDNANDES